MTRSCATGRAAGGASTGTAAIGGHRLPVITAGVLPCNAPDNRGIGTGGGQRSSTGSVVEEARATPPGDGGTRQTSLRHRTPVGRPKCRARPDRKTSPKMTFTLTWPRAVAPVRRGRLPTPSCRRESGLIAPVVSRLQAFQFDAVMLGMSTAAPVHRGQRPAAGANPSPGSPPTAGSRRRRLRLYRARRVVVEHRSRLPAGHPAGPLLRYKTTQCIWRPWPISPWWRAKSGCPDRRRRSRPPSSECMSALWSQCGGQFQAVRLGQLWSLILFVSALLPQLHFQIRAFRPGF